MFCVEALCKLQSVLVPLTLAIGVLAESFFSCLRGEVRWDVSFDTKSTIK